MLEHGHRIGIFRGDWLFDEKRVERFQHSDDSAGRGEVPLTVAFHADIKIGSGFADAGEHLAHLVENGCRKLAIVPGVRAEWVVLSRRGALSDQLLRTMRIRVARSGNVTPAITGIDSDFISCLAPEQFIEWNVQSLSDNVPKGDVDSANGGKQRTPQRVFLDDLHVSPKLLNIPGAFVENQLPALADLAEHSRRTRRSCPLAPAVESVRGLYPCQRIAGSVSDAHQIWLNLGDLER